MDAGSAFAAVTGQLSDRCRYSMIYARSPTSARCQPDNGSGEKCKGRGLGEAGADWCARDTETVSAVREKSIAVSASFGAQVIITTDINP